MNLFLAILKNKKNGGNIKNKDFTPFLYIVYLEKGKYKLLLFTTTYGII
jgi:hypothetical protein